MSDPGIKRRFNTDVGGKYTLYKTEKNKTGKSGPGITNIRRKPFGYINIGHVD